MRVTQLTIVLALLAALSACDREPNPPAAESGHAGSRTEEAHEGGEVENEAVPSETTIAAKTAQDMGLKPVAHMGGGFAAWRDAGGPIEPWEPKKKG